MPTSTKEVPSRESAEVKRYVEESARSRQTEIPQNIEAEKSVLAACMLDKEAVDGISILLRPDSFLRPAHRKIFEAMLDLQRRNVDIDQISVAEALRASGQLDAVGGKAYIAGLAENIFALSNWRTHASIVSRTAIQRNLILASAQITALAYESPDDMTELVESAERTLFDVTEKRVSSEFTNIGTLVTDAFNQISEMARNHSDLQGVPTGFKDLDRLFHGWRPGDLIILAARPGVGKTSLALNIASRAAAAGTAVAFFSLEMSSGQLVQRVLCSEAGIGLEKVRGGFLAEADWSRLLEAAGTLSSREFFIDDTPGLSIMEARAKARRELRGKENGLIIVDYLQLMQGGPQRRNASRNDEVGEISRGLKLLAKEMGMPVLALSQLSRAVEQRGGNKRPQLSDLRESGSIEQDADIVMFIDRSTSEMEAESDNRPEWGTATVIVAKHRNGATRDITLAYRPENTTFSDYIDASQYSGAI